MIFSAHYDDHWMDSPHTQSPALTDPSYLVSSRFPSQENRPLDRPVLIAVHGFSATPYEWLELKEYMEHPDQRGSKGGQGHADSDNDPIVSLVLLGGHGRDLNAFKKACWQDWGHPILDEYQALRKQGYQRIHFIGASTGALLLLKYIADGEFGEDAGHFFFIDPFFKARDPLFKFAGILSYLKSYHGVYRGRNDQVLANWYNNYPGASLRQLRSLQKNVANIVTKGLQLPEHLHINILQSNNDPTSDPEGSINASQHIRDSNGEPVPLTMVNSSNHMFLHGRSRELKEWGDAETEIQQNAFEYILSLITK